MKRDCEFYICPVCFVTSETPVECHGHWMIRCDAFDLDDERRKPAMSPRGRLKSRAPRWFIEAVREHQVGSGL
jgi:hypothetical protein